MQILIYNTIHRFLKRLGSFRDRWHMDKVMMTSIAAVTEYQEDKTQLYFVLMLTIKKQNAGPAEKQYMELVQHNISSSRLCRFDDDLILVGMAFL